MIHYSPFIIFYNTTAFCLNLHLFSSLLDNIDWVKACWESERESGCVLVVYVSRVWGSGDSSVDCRYHFKVMFVSACRVEDVVCGYDVEGERVREREREWERERERERERDSDWEREREREREWEREREDEWNSSCSEWKFIVWNCIIL